MTEPIPAERILELAAPLLTELGGTWTLAPGPVLRAKGSVAVRVVEPHTDNFRHVDLEILLNIDLPVETSIVDCSMGLDPDPETAVRQALGAWIDTTASAALEVVQGRGRLATHLQPDAPGGYPGWHAIVGGASGWSVDGSSDKQQWFADAAPWGALAHVIEPALDRERLNGVRLFVGQGGDTVECEVRVNGRRHEPACDALAALDWPRSERMAVARVFLLLVHRAVA